MAIHIKTRLDDGIYEDLGGGRVVTHYTWQTTVTNLIRALRVLPQHCDEMREHFGGLGSGRSWLEVDGIRSPEDADTILDPEADLDGVTGMRAKAKRLIARIEEGYYSDEQTAERQRQRDAEWPGNWDYYS